MKLVPLGDKIVLKQCRSRGDYKVRYRFTGSGYRRNRSRQRSLPLDLAEW